MTPSMAFSPDGKTVLTGSWDKSVRLWEAATGKAIGKAIVPAAKFAYEHRDEIARAVAVGATVTGHSDVAAKATIRRGLRRRTLGHHSYIGRTNNPGPRTIVTAKNKITSTPSAKAMAIEQTWNDVPLTLSFRSTEPVLNGFTLEVEPAPLRLLPA